MIKKVVALLAVALTAVLLLPSDPADARRGGGGGGGFRAGGGGGGGGLRMARVARAPVIRPMVVQRRTVIVRRPIVRRVVRTPIFVAGVSGCEWLRHRAIATGSPYWWRRYHRCRGY